MPDEVPADVPIPEPVPEPTPIPPPEPIPEPIQPQVEAPIPSEAPTAQIPASEPIAPEPTPVVEPPTPPPPAPGPAPAPAPAPQQSAPVSVIAPVVHFARDLLIKARGAIQSRKRKKLEKILGAVTKHGSITNDQVEKLLHVSDATATRYLTQLEKEGKLKQEGKTGKSVKYSKM